MKETNINAKPPSTPAAGSDRTDTERLDWLQRVLTPDDNYCEMFFAGLRDFLTANAHSFQIECNPEKFRTLNALTVRDAIDAAMLLHDTTTGPKKLRHSRGGND